MTEVDLNIPVITLKSVYESVYYYLHRADYYRYCEEGWMNLEVAHHMASLIPFEFRDNQQFKDYEKLAHEIHNKLRDESEKAEQRGQLNFWMRGRPNKSHGKGNRAAVRKMMKKVREEVDLVKE